MDPDANLREQLELVAKVDEMTDGEKVHAFERLADLVEGLNDWITHHGHLPKAWRK
jgi:hypothetical protein